MTKIYNVVGPGLVFTLECPRSHHHLTHDIMCYVFMHTYNKDSDSLWCTISKHHKIHNILQMLN